MEKTRMISLLYNELKKQGQGKHKGELFQALVTMIQSNEIVVFLDESTGETTIQTIH
tara:strand:+ start:231 stop:401 length:171 start_codon:yes stop_codon:yes gene_type:complete